MKGRNVRVAAHAAMGIRAAAVLAMQGIVLPALATTVYDIECRDRHGKLKWRESGHNLVVNTGLNELIDKTFKASSYTAAWYVGLKGTGTVAAGDTLASHGGWSEITDYTGNRKALTLGTVSGGAADNSASPASFAINDTATVAGAFLATVDTGTSGVLYGAVNFAAPREVEDGDTLNVTATASIAAA